MREESPRSTTCVLKTSTILISTGDEQRVYRSLRDVPQDLRKTLLKCTAGPNSGSVIIADRRGRQQLKRAIVGVRQSAARRSADSASAPPGRMPVRRALACCVLLLSMLWLGLLFFRA